MEIEYTTIRVPVEVKDELERKKKELQLVNVGAVVEKLLKYIDKIK